VGAAKSGAVGAKSAIIDTNLQAIIDAWPDLPESTRAKILAMIESDQQV